MAENNCSCCNPKQSDKTEETKKNTKESQNVFFIIGIISDQFQNLSIDKMTDMIYD